MHKPGVGKPAGGALGDVSSQAAYITDVKVRNYGSRSAGVTDVTFGQVFADGAVPAQQNVVAVVDGTVLPTQVDRKATWSNGSLSHAVITVQLEAPESGSRQTLALYAVHDAAGSGFTTLTLGELLGTNFSANIRITRDSMTYAANARRALQAVMQTGDCPAWGQPGCKRWLAGGLTSEWIVPAELTTGNKLAPRLRVYFNVRAYRGADGGIANVRVDTVIENDQAYAVRPSNVSYSAKITAGNEHYTVNHLTHYRQARWQHVLWTQGAPELYARPSSAYLQSTGAISRYADVSPSNAFLNSVPRKFAPMKHGNQTQDMGATGAQAAIGPLPKWTSTYVVSGGDRRAFDWMLANDNAAGSYGFHYRDGQTGRALTIVDHPYVTIAAIDYARRAGGRFAKDLLPKCHRHGKCRNPNRFELSHHPSIGYLPYLVTGDFYYLEETQFAASYVELWANPTYRKHDKGRLLRAQQQVRGQAWSLRSISDAAFATPDADPMKPVFVQEIGYIIQSYLATYVDDPGHDLHTLDRQGAIHYPSGVNTSIAPWQADFFAWAAGHAAEQGVPGAQRLIDWLAPFQIGMMTSAKDGDTDGFCWILASAYTLKLRDSENSPEYRTLSEAYDETFPRASGLACGSQAMANQLSRSDDRLTAGQMTGFSPSPTGFPSNLQIALAMAADTDADKAHQAWEVFTHRSRKPDYANYPNFALVPRSMN